MTLGHFAIMLCITISVPSCFKCYDLMYEEMIVSLRDSEDLQILLPLSDYKETEVYQFYTTKLI